MIKSKANKPGLEEISRQRLLIAVANLGPVAYPLAVALFALGSVFGVPATLLLLAAVAGFGWWPGAVVSVLGGTLGAYCSFLLARHLARDWVAARLGSHPALLRLDQQIGERGGWIVLWLRILPSLPFTLFNLLCGLTRIGSGKFAAATLVGIVPGTLAYGWAADQLLRLGNAAGAKPHPLPTLLAMLLLALLTTASWWVKRRRRAQAERAARGQPAARDRPLP
nr:TVP38/TMEM64 family membrane protein slr0305-like [Nerophis lumbriciformis]